MSYPCKLSPSKECDGCGRCEIEREYVLTCENCRREIENLEMYVCIKDHDYCEDCIEDSWRQWYKSPGGISKRLRRMRSAEGLTQKRFADVVGVSEALVRSWESGARPMKAQYIKTINHRIGRDP